MSMLNSWSRKTVRPSFSDELEPVAAGDAVAGPVVEVLVADHALDAGEVVVGGGGGAGQHVLGVEDVQALVLHRADVEVLDRDDHEAVQVQRQPEARLVPHHRGDQRVHRVLGLVQVAAAHVHLQQVVAAGARADAAARAPPGRRPPARTGSWASGRGRATSRSGGRLVEIALLDQVAVAQQHRVASPCRRAASRCRPPSRRAGRGSR